MEIDDVLEGLKTRPETYRTILGEVLNNNDTRHRILRRKLNLEFMQGNVCKMLVPGSMFCKIIYYSLEKEYTIFLFHKGLYTEVFYAKKVKDDGIYVTLDECYILRGFSWEKQPKTVLDRENIMKVL